MNCSLLANALTNETIL